MADGLFTYCGGLTKIVSFIYEHRVIKKILAHLGLLRGEEQKREPPAPPKKCLETVLEPFDDDWPEYEKTFIDIQVCIIVCFGIMPPNFGEYYHVFAGKDLGNRERMSVIGYSAKKM